MQSDYGVYPVNYEVYIDKLIMISLFERLLFSNNEIFFVKRD